MSLIKTVLSPFRAIMLLACMATFMATTFAVEPGKGDNIDKCFAGYQGVFVLHDTAGKTSYQYNDKLASKAFSPCSTFKIFLALVGLETGAIKDDYTVEKWDGNKSQIDTWNRDHNLRTAMAESVNWYFQRISSRIGKDDLQKYLKLLHYGNEDMSSGLDNFWTSSEGSLHISPTQQVDFLERLFAEKLPISARSQQVVKQVLKVEDGPNGALSGKTGTEQAEGKLVSGWFVGFLQGKDDNYIFATHIQSPTGANGRRAREISKAVLKQLGIW